MNRTKRETGEIINSLFKKAVIGLSISAQLGLASCAPSAEDVHPSYVSPLQYQGYSCRQIRSEMMVVARHVSEASGTQDHHAGNDAAATAVGVVLFWPALFFLASKDDRGDLARLKGEYDALEQAAIQKDCSVAKEIEAARKMEEERKAKDKAQQQQNQKYNER